MLVRPNPLILTSPYGAGLSPPKPNRYHFQRRRFTTILHIASLLASLIAIALFSAAIPQWNANFFHNAGPNRGDWTDGIPLGPLIFAFLYHVTVLGHSLIHRTRGSDVHWRELSKHSLVMHTTVPVLVLVGLLPALLLAGYGSLFRFWQPAVRTQNGILVCNTLNIFARECEPTLYDIGNLQIAGLVFGTLLWNFHFALLLVSFRDFRRYTLAKQLQREKIAQYAHPGKGGSRSHRARRTRGFGGGPHSLTQGHGSSPLAHDAWLEDQNTAGQRQRDSSLPQAEVSSSSRPAPPSDIHTANRGETSRDGPPRRNRGRTDEFGRQPQQPFGAVPIKAPVASRPRMHHRSG